MNKKNKLLTVVGTRPELIRLSRIIPSLDKSFNHILVHTNQNFDKNLNEIFFKDLDIRKPDYFFKTKNVSSIKLIGDIFVKIQKIIDKEKPNAFFVLGDTNSCLTAYVAKKNKIPIFHYESGNRSYDQNVPEEINRKVVDHLSDVNITYSENSKSNLIREGVNPEFIFNVGSPLNEVLDFYKKKIDNSKILKKLSLRKNDFILVSSHRQENLEDKELFINFVRKIINISIKLKKKIIFSTHPRTKKILDKVNLKNKKKIFLNPLNFSDYNCLQKNSYIVLSDSGTINEESDILKFDAINLRDNHERHEAMENGSTIMTKFDENNILNSISIVKSTKIMSNISDYQAKDVSSKICRIIQSYIFKINKKIYFK